MGGPEVLKIGLLPEIIELNMFWGEIHNELPKKSKATGGRAQKDLSKVNSADKDKEIGKPKVLEVWEKIDIDID